MAFNKTCSKCPAGEDKVKGQAWPNPSVGTCDSCGTEVCTRCFRYFSDIWWQFDSGIMKYIEDLDDSIKKNMICNNCVDEVKKYIEESIKQTIALNIQYWIDIRAKNIR